MSVTNEPLADTLKSRARLKAAVREFFSGTGAGYLEVDTPVGVICPGTEVHLGYFETAWRDHQKREHRLFLRSSPELHMKQALAALGEGGIFQLATCFRNDGEISAWHHPEFTMLEFYETGTSYHDFIARTEALLTATREAFKATKVPKTFRRVTVAEAFREWAGLELEDEDPELAPRGKSAGIRSLRGDEDFETAFFKILIDRIEPGIEREGAVVLHDYPASQAALAMVEGEVARRFEFYVGRAELCNGFQELLDPAANRARIRAAMARRKALGSVVPDEDEDFYAALENGLKPCCGNALGFERWLALLLGRDGIASAVPFRAAAPYRGHE